MKPEPMKIERRNLLNLFPIQVIWPCLLIKTPARNEQGVSKSIAFIYPVSRLSETSSAAGPRDPDEEKISLF